MSEQNPTIDAAVITKLQSVITAGYKQFQNVQNELLDVKQTYQASLEVFPNNMVASTCGFPRIDIGTFNIVLSEETEKAFETGKMKAIDPFQKQ